MVPLSTLGKLRPTVGPEFVSHYDIYGSALINGAPAAGYSSGQAIAAMQRAAARVLPADFGHEWTGITYQQLKAGAVAGIVFVLAMVFVFLFLAAQYESWSMPFNGHPSCAACPVRRGDGAMGSRHAVRRLFADRLRHADRPVGQERDPDR